MNSIMFAYFATLLCGLAALIVFLSIRTKKACAKATVAKAATSFFFILSWLMLAAAHGTVTAYIAFIGAGLVCGLLGDIFLDLKYCCPKGEEDFYTYSGFISFAIGHVFYILAVILGTNSGFHPVAVLPALGVAVVVALVVFFGEKVMKLNYGKFKAISTFYGGLLFGMASFALFSALFSDAGIKGNMHLLGLFIGGILFAVSDLILSGTYFGEGKNRPVDVITNHVTYYLAQYVIAATVLLVK